MPVPKAAVHEDHLAVPLEDNIWIAGQAAVVKPVAIAHPVQHAAYDELGLGVFPADAGHPL